MTTKKIRQALRLVDANAFPYQGDRNDVRTLLREALAEVEAIESMCFWLKGETKQTAEESRSVALLESIANDHSEVS